MTNQTVCKLSTRQVRGKAKKDFFCSAQIFLLVVLTVAFAFGAQADEKVQKEPTLYVTGLSQLPVIPDVGELVLGIEADGKTAGEAQTKASAVLTAFIGQLKGVGIQAQEIKTVQSSLNPVRDYNTKAPHKIISYTAIQKIKIRVVGENRLNLISRAVDLATQNSINHIESVGFTVSPERMKEVKRKALAAASDDAIKSAKEVLSSLGLTFQRVKEIHLNSGNYNFYQAAPMARGDMYASLKAAPEAAPEISTIMPGEMMVEGSVNLTVEFQ